MMVMAIASSAKSAVQSFIHRANRTHSFYNIATKHAIQSEAQTLPADDRMHWNRPSAIKLQKAIPG